MLYDNASFFQIWTILFLFLQPWEKDMLITYTLEIIWQKEVLPYICLNPNPVCYHLRSYHGEMLNKINSQLTCRVRTISHMADLSVIFCFACSIWHQKKTHYHKVQQNLNLFNTCLSHIVSYLFWNQTRLNIDKMYRDQ